jgi:uncharacterized delta-60 repeat protein
MSFENGFATIERLEGRLCFSFGDVDTSFGTSGQVIDDRGDSDFGVNDLTVAGSKVYAVSDVIVRYTSAGKTDTSFAEQGTLNVKVIIQQLLVDASGNLFVGGYDSSNTEVIQKFKSNGSVDASFGDNGQVALADERDFGFQTASLQSDGKILVAGLHADPDGVTDQTRIYRVTAGGTLDATFGKKGVVNIQLGTGEADTPGVVDSVRAIRQLASGSIIISGLSYSVDPPQEQPDSTVGLTLGDGSFVAARLTSAGALDKSYGKNGFARAPFETGVQIEQFFQYDSDNDAYPTISAVSLIDASGNVVIAARAEAFSAVKFDGRGKVAFASDPQPSYPLKYPGQIVQLPDGRYVVSGSPINIVDQGAMLTTISSDGEIGSWFSVQDLEGNGGASLAVASDGNLLIGGNASMTLGQIVEKLTVGNASDPRGDNFANGQNNALTGDNERRLDLAYFDTATKSLKFAQRQANGRWGSPVTVDSAMDAGMQLSIAVGSNDQPAIAYFDGLHGDLKFATTSDNGRTWKTQTVDFKGSTGLYPSLVFDSANRAAIAYYDKARHCLKFASLKSDGTWGFTYVDSSANVGRSASLSMNPDTGQLAIAYADTTNKALKEAFYQGKGIWQTQVAAVTQGGVDFISGGNQGGLDALILYHDIKEDQTKLALYSLKEWNIHTVVAPTAPVVHGVYNTLVYSQGEPYEVTYDHSLNSSFVFGQNRDGKESAADKGGEYLSAFASAAFAGGTDLAYVDNTDHLLKVRSGPIMWVPPDLGE